MTGVYALGQEDLKRIVSGAAAGRSLQAVAADTGVPYQLVGQVARANGYPDLAQLRRSLDTHLKDPVRLSPTPDGRVKADGFIPPDSELEALLTSARAAGLGTKADRIAKLIGELVGQMRQQEALTKALDDLEKAKARVAALRKKAAAEPGAEFTKEHRQRIRQWAMENGHPIGDRGRIPDEVVAAFRAAVGEERA